MVPTLFIVTNSQPITVYTLGTSHINNGRLQCQLQHHCAAATAASGTRAAAVCAEHVS